MARESFGISSELALPEFYLCLVEAVLILPTLLSHAPLEVQ